MDTNNFRTKTHFIRRSNPTVDGFWGIALDVGYSSVKAYGPNSICSFPSFAKKVDNTENFGRPTDSDILYKDETGVYVVGEQAYAQINPKDSSNDTNSMFIRDRFSNRIFLIISRVGLALSMNANQYGDPAGKKIKVQTGLPPAYLTEDSCMLIDALSGHHTFAVKQGANPWKQYDFDLARNDISVMPQPMGTLISISTDKDGKTVPNAKRYFNSNVLIFDPGFGTLDTFNIKNNMIDDFNTYKNLGMHRVFTELTKEIRNTYGPQIQVHELQEDLKTGTFRKFDRNTHGCVATDFSDLLEKCSKKVCDEALATIDETYNYLQYHDYLVLTGGTSSAWDKYIKDYYKNMETLQIINGTLTDDIPSIFTNARGYYNKLLNDLRKAARGAGQ